MKVRTKLLLAIACSLLLLLLFYMNKRGEVLMDYRQLLADPNAFRTLQTVPSLREWRATNMQQRNRLDIGYASFLVPFEEIKSISGNATVVLKGETTTVKLFPLVVYDDTLTAESSAEKLADYTYRGGTISERQEKYKEYDLKLAEREARDPFAFRKSMYNTTPKSMISLLLMPFGDLYIYEKMLEQKYQNLGSSELFFFKTDRIKGYVQNEQNNLVLILIWDLQTELYQAVSVFSTVTISNQDIEQFLSSFSFNMDVITTDSDLETVVHDALVEYQEYFVEP